MASRGIFKASFNREYNVLEIYMPGWPYPLRIGKTKAKAIVKNFKEIKKFAKEG